MYNYYQKHNATKDQYSQGQKQSTLSDKIKNEIKANAKKFIPNLMAGIKNDRKTDLNITNTPMNSSTRAGKAQYKEAVSLFAGEMVKQVDSMFDGDGRLTVKEFGKAIDDHPKIARNIDFNHNHGTANNKGDGIIDAKDMAAVITFVDGFDGTKRDGQCNTETAEDALKEAWWGSTKKDIQKIHQEFNF